MNRWFQHIIVLLALSSIQCADPSYQYLHGQYTEAAGTIEGLFTSPQDCFLCASDRIDYNTVIFRFDDTWEIIVSQEGYLGNIGDTLYGPQLVIPEEPELLTEDDLDLFE